MDSHAFPNVPDKISRLKTKKWLKEVLLQANWPPKMAKNDGKSLKKAGFVMMNSMSRISQEDWELMDIPLGIKVIIQDILTNTISTLSYEIGSLEIKANDDLDHHHPDRIIVMNEKGERFEIDRYCPHKKADLTTVHVYCHPSGHCRRIHIDLPQAQVEV